MENQSESAQSMRIQLEKGGQSISTFRSLQDVQAHFCYLNKLDMTPQITLALLDDEVMECKSALASDDITEITGELADIVIFVATVSNSLHSDLHSTVIKQHTAPLFSVGYQTNQEISQIQKIRQKSQARRKPKSNKEIMEILLGHLNTTKTDNQIGQKERVISSLGDITLCAIDLANLYGIDLQEAITKKMERNYAKYNPAITRDLIDKGYTPEEAHLMQKSLWDRDQDHEYLKQEILVPLKVKIDIFITPLLKSGKTLLQVLTGC